MMIGHGYLANYDYVDLRVERRADHWSLILQDSRHGESVESDETFATSSEAMEAALFLARHHINIQHNDTLLAETVLSWQEY